MSSKFTFHSPTRTGTFSDGSPFFIYEDKVDEGDKRYSDFEIYAGKVASATQNMFPPDFKGAMVTMASCGSLAQAVALAKTL